MNIMTPGVPKRLRITPGMVDDFLWDPVLAARFFLGVRFDWFQRVRLKMMWFVPFMIDSSGFTSGKTITNWAYIQLRALLLPESPCVVYYPVFQQGVRTFWEYYYRVGGSAIFRAHLGKLDEEGEEQGKSNSKMSGCYKAHFRNGSRVEMPAPSLMRDAITQASTRFNTSLFDEWTYFDAAGGAINSQLIGRNTKPAFYNDNHPIWANHLKFTATAKSQLHPAFDRVKKTDSQVKRGNVKYCHIRFCYKDHTPGFQDAEGRTVRNDAAVKIVRDEMSEAEQMGEIFGLWGKNTKGWYSESDLLRCVELGIMCKARPVSSRGEDERVSQGSSGPSTVHGEGGKTVYFGGIDPAPAQANRNDDGSIAILRVRQIIAPMETEWREREMKVSDSPGDYDCSWALLRRLRDADSGEWSGHIHSLHRSFGVSKWLMDMGAAGGGLFVKKDLAKQKQRLNCFLHGGSWRSGEELTDCTPILTMDDLGVRGHFCLHAFKRRDAGIERLWTGLAGDDVLLDMAHSEMRTAIMKAIMKWPKRFPEWTEEEKLCLGEENIWSLRNLDASLDQFGLIGVAMTEDKTQYELTKNGARQFYAARGRKDHQMSMMLAWIAFLIWLRFDAGALTQSVEDEALCG
jgi:hypothetical protein